MTPHVVADVGNSRIKWGFCLPDDLIVMQSHPPEDTDVWQKRFDSSHLAPGSLWVLAGVHPARRDRFANWLRERGQQVHIVTHPRELPLRTRLPEPEKAGIDRLLNAVAVTRRRPPGRPAVIVDAGSAVTVDYVDESGAFAGGAIFPGIRLMAKALHDYTALLPLIELPDDVPDAPASATVPAMQAGVYGAVAGGISRLVAQYRSLSAEPPTVFLTGGDWALLRSTFPDAVFAPTMTLDGLRWTAETLS